MTEPLTDEEFARFEAFQEEKLDAHHAAEDEVRHVFFIGSGIMSSLSRKLDRAVRESEACEVLESVLRRHRKDRAAALQAVKQLRRSAEKRGDDVAYGVFDAVCRDLQG